MTWQKLWSYLPEQVSCFYGASCILPIYPCYCDKIFSGVKIYEFRKKPLRVKTQCCIVYETTPTSKVVGYFKIDEIYVGPLDSVWSLASDHGGLTWKDFERYYCGCDVGVAIRISSPCRLDAPINPLTIGLTAPQSYIYI